MSLLIAAAPAPGCEPEQPAAPRAQASVAGDPLGMVVDYVTGTATVFDADTGTIRGTVPGLGDTTVSGDCSITADGTKAFFTNFGYGLTVADLASDPPALAGPPNPIAISNPGEDTALSPDGRFLVVCDGGGPLLVSVVDIATQAEIGTFDTGSSCTSVDVCSDGSVLITTLDSVRRLALSPSGVLTDTGESLAISRPGNVYCSPAATAGVVVSYDERAISFELPGLTSVSFLDLDSNGVSGAINHAGDRAYFRTGSGSLSGFTFDQATAVLGSAPLFQVGVASTQAFYGIDQLAVHPSDASVYVSEPGALRILDAATGAALGSIAGGSMQQITGVCFGAAAPNRPPVARCADVGDAPAGNTCQAIASVDAGSSDPDGDRFSCIQSPSGPYGLGTTPVTLTCTDVHGASASCRATVTVVDRTSPVLGCPAVPDVECTDRRCGAVATFTTTATDSCDAAPSLACAPPSGATFPLGTTTVACTATDRGGNVGECTRSVRVVDTRPATVITKNAGSLWPPNHRYHRIDLADCIASIQDACHGPLDVASHATVTCCTSDEPDDGLGDGDAPGDCVIVDRDSVDLRAERAGNGNGRVYTIHYTVDDGSGNTTSHACLVTVPHSQNGGPAIDDGPQTPCP